jgi:hypothetical protein
MDHGHDHSHLCGGVCHLNEAAKALYLDLVLADRGEEAEALSRYGTIPPDKVLIDTVTR